QRQLVRIQCGQDRRGIARIDDCGMIAIVDDPQIVVVERRDGQYIQHGMDNISSEKSIISLGAWLQSPAGSYVRNWEQACLEKLTTDIFGFHATQIGLPQIEALRGSRMPHIWLTDVQLPAADYDNAARPLVAIQEFEELPYASASIDLVVLPHVLEFVAEPHQVLREVERVLIPEGQVIICGFNPWSLWGARQMLGRVSDDYFLPQDG